MEKATDNTLDIRRYWREMRRLRWVYILAFICIVGLASIYVVRSLKHCESTAMVLIEESTSDTGSGASKGGGLMGMMKMFSVGGFGSSSVDNEIFLIRSHDIAVRTVKALGLTSTYIERDGLKKHLLFPNSPVKATMPQSVLDTLAFPFLIRVEISPDQHVNAKTMRGRLFWRTTFDEVKDATLPVNLDTPYGPVTLTAGDMSLLDGKKMDIDIVISGVKTAALKLEKNTSTDVVDKLADAIEITLSGGSDAYCNTVLAEYINQYNNRRIERRAENAMSELEFYDARIADLFSDLSESEEKLEKFKSENNLIGMDAQASMLVESTVGKTEAITVERTKQEYYRIVKSTLENPESANSLIPVVESLGNPMIAKYNELLLARKNLERSATGENPQLVALNDQIDELRTSILKNVDGMLAESRMQLEAMSGLMGTAQSRLNKMPAYEREYINLMRDRTMKNELYMFLLQKRENAALQVSSTSTLGFVIDPPHTPEKASNIKNIILILVAIFLSFALPTFLAIFLVLWRNRVEDTSDLASMHIESRAVMVSSDDASSITGLRTQILSSPEQTTVYVCNLADSDGNTIVGELTESLEHIGRQVNLINHLEDNDAILSPRFQPLLKSGAYNFIVMPDSSHISAYVDSFNADNATLLVIIKSGAMRRNVLRSLLRGIYADKVVTAILR